MDTKQAPKLDNVMTALSNKHRRQIIEILSLQPASILQLAERLAVSLPAINRHIKVLEVAHLVQRKKVGRVNFLALQRTGLLELQAWASQFHAYWGNDNESLENYVKGIKESNERINAK